MDVTFPYRYEGESFFGPVYRIFAEVVLTSSDQKKDVKIWMIVDSGADFTILPRLYSEKLRISLEHDCMVDSTEGVGGNQTIYLCKKRITAKIGKMERKIPFAFFDNNEVPPLLGRLGFMETFNVSFLKTRKVMFKS